MKRGTCLILTAILALAAASCDARKRVEASTPAPCALALAPLGGSEPIDREIAALQEKARSAHDQGAIVERLGWKLVEKARRSYDAGFYRLAEQCALCIEASGPGSPEALLLRGHVLHSLHRFREAEDVARALMAAREFPADQGLLGDALLEQGKLDEAAEAYQRMMDLKPSLHSYARAAHLRWLKGDVVGAVEAGLLAARAGSARDPESTAWAWTRLAVYRLQAGDLAGAHAATSSALAELPGYAPALLADGRILLAERNTAGAVDRLRRAHELNPLPEYAWLLADALRAADNVDEARRIEGELRASGASRDPRTLALFLATQKEDVETALQLARKEIDERADVHTHDALGWCLAAAGRTEEAMAELSLALREGTQDARIFLHVGLVHASAGDVAAARPWLEKAGALERMLYPSERDLLAGRSAWGSPTKKGDRT